jgi:hypothetical protein
MTNPMIRIHNLETNEIIDREMNAEELAVYEAEQASFLATKNAEVEAAAAKEAALAKLETLGLTVEDLAALGL